MDFDELSNKYDNIFISAITYIETLGYNFQNLNEKEIVELILNSFPIIQTNMEIIQQVVTYRQYNKIKTPDALILATAKNLNADLVTYNESDFRSIDPSINIYIPKIVLP